jgi:2-methylcitrate synthase
MDSLRTAVSFLGLTEEFISDNSREENLRKAVLLLAKIPSIIGACYRNKNGLRPLTPRKDLSIAANLFHMCFEQVPVSDVVKALDASLTLYAEHGFNASTFTARVVVSSLSDMVSGITAAIGSLKGPLHGGANEAVMRMLMEVETSGDPEKWLHGVLQQKKKVMGFGHRLYRIGDSRVPTMKMYRDKLAAQTDQNKWVNLSDKLEELMIEAKSIYPNLDFPAGPAYYMMGFEIDMFTPIFVMSRVTGWAAHIIEQQSDNRLVRPMSDYNGAAFRPVVDIIERN